MYGFLNLQLSMSLKLARYLVCHKTGLNNLDTYLEIE